MATKQDRVSRMEDKLKGSMAAESASLEQRFRAADATFAKTGGILLGRDAPPGDDASPPATNGRPHVDLPAGEGAVLTVSIDRVHDNPENSRQCYPSDEIEELAASMATSGQKEPVQAMPHPEIPGHWMLLSGHKRRRAAVRAAITEIKLIAHRPVHGLERYRLSLTFNQHTRESAIDNARAWAQLLGAGYVQTYDELADQLGISKALLSKTLAFNKLPEAALARIREHPHRFGPAAGQLLAQIAQTAEEEHLLDLVEGVADERVTVRQLEAAAKQTTTERRERRSKQNSRQYRIKAADVEVGVLRDWDDGRVSLDIVLDDPKRRAALVDLLKKELGVD